MKITREDSESVEKGKTKTFAEKQLNEIDPENYVEYFKKYQ